MQPSSISPPRPAAGGRSGSAILLILVTMIVLVGIDLAAWRFQYDNFASHENIALWGTYLGFGVIAGLVALLVRSSNAVVPFIGVIVVTAGSFADLFLIAPVLSSRLGSDGFSEVLKQEMQHIGDILKNEPNKVYAAIGGGVVIFLILSLIGLATGRSRVRRAPMRHGQSPYSGHQGSQPFTPGGPPPQQGPQTPPPFQPQSGPQTPPPFPGAGLYSPPPYGQAPGPQQHGQPTGPPSFGQQNPPPYDPDKLPRSPDEPAPYGQQSPPSYGQQDPPRYGREDPPQYGQQDPPRYGQQSPPPYGQQDPPRYGRPASPPPYGQNEPRREEADDDEPGPELPPLPPPPSR